MTRVKICGITSEEDAAAAVGAGANALGFIFAPNTPRLVPAELAAEIVRRLPPFVTPVGVFVNQPLEDVLDLAARCGLQAVQLHGDEPPEYSRGIPLPVIRAVRVRDAASLEPLRCYPARAFLLDAFVEGVQGGTGTTIPWELAAQAAGQATVILSGGLTPENVGQAVRQVHPYGVDVSSGVELRPGRKDHRKVREFIATVRRADLR